MTEVDQRAEFNRKIAERMLGGRWVDQPTPDFFRVPEWTIILKSKLVEKHGEVITELTGERCRILVPEWETPPNSIRRCMAESSLGECEAVALAYIHSFDLY